jgi:mannose-6-phosphate isomerase-like protein (cupin superfamily)
LKFQISDFLPFSSVISVPSVAKVHFMDIQNILHRDEFFAVLQTSGKSQTAVMVLEPGKASGPFGNEHPGSEQVVLVAEGEILAEVGEEKATLRKGDVIIIPRKIAHRLVNHGGSKAVVFSVYAPPGYDADESSA